MTAPRTTVSHREPASRTSDRGKRNPSSFKPGASYTRDDGKVMVEITPGNFVNEDVARRLGVTPSGERA